VVTALVALAGLFMKIVSAKVDSDFKQLEIVEKMAAMKKDGVEIPKVLALKYLAGK
jgi:hypothetical protein